MQDIKRLVKMAYLNAPLDFRDQITKDSFIESLNEQEMEWSVFQGRPRNLEDAVRLALEYEAFQQARGRRNRIAVRMQREEPMDANIRNDARQIGLISQNTEKSSTRKVHVSTARKMVTSRVNVGYYNDTWKQRKTRVKENRVTPTA